MVKTPPLFDIHPPLVNSACPWATTLEDLRRLYACPSTGAVTTRTSLIQGFGHDPDKHQFVFFDAARAAAEDPASAPLNASVNSLGYSPVPLATYLDFIQTLSDEAPPSAGPAPAAKGFIVSVTGSPEDVAASYALLAAAAPRLRFPLAMEINLSCPNIPGRPPPAYERDALVAYLAPLRRAITEAHAAAAAVPIPVGLKTPPYTYATQFLALLDALESATQASEGGSCPVSFLTATNTLGSCLLLSSSSSFSNPSSADAPPFVPAPVLPHDGPEASSSSSSSSSLGTGGMAGAPLHPLALGNVATLRRLLDERAPALGRRVAVVGVGGVADAAGYRRMRAAGADVVGLATGLGLRGVDVFREVEAGLEGKW
ncbi:hypothetical protein VTJ83DRAFT_3984 [Remersonia thermophila]|uniref:Dihydroorotate dehydrogenase (fumarate) n=1 Tax=Remersonia thermophila TaxID=72144 RepID=A0ABR4DFJ7_9PEZI